MSTVKRSVVKTVSYRAAIVLANGVVVYALTGKMDLALGVGGVTAVINTAMYFVNERLWDRISWGRLA